jgi:hypothetical protein
MVARIVSDLLPASSNPDVPASEIAGKTANLIQKRDRLQDRL